MSPKARPKKGDVAADAAVYDAIRRAMHRGRLAPGTKLQEPALARLLEVSRERVRKALHRLVHEGWLTAVPKSAPDQFSGAGYKQAITDVKFMG